MRHNRTVTITSREEKQIKDLINLVHKVILEQRKLHITSHVYRKRTYTLQSNNSKFVAIPSHVVVEDDLHKSLFEPLLTWLESLSRARKQKDDTAVFRPRFCGISKLEMSTEEDNLTENIKQTGSKIKVLWSAEEVGDSGWKPGWYPATVQKYCEETDILTVVYLLEPGICYEEELSPLTANKKIKLEWAAL